LAESSLVLVGRVADVSEVKITMGGKGESALLQFKFEPVLVLKGVFSRESLVLTSDDLGVRRFADTAPIKPGQLRLLMLGRSSQGYAILRPSPSLEQAIPPLRDRDDGLLETVKVLLTVNATPERPRKVALLLDGLRRRKGPAAIPLLAALERRSLLAAQTSGVTEALAPHLSDPSPGVREQAAKALYYVLEADYLDQPTLHEDAVNALAISLERTDSSVAPRVAAFEALGAAGSWVLKNKSAEAHLEFDPPSTFAEQGARLRALGQLKMPGQESAVLALLKQVPLDAPMVIQHAAEWALARFDPTVGVREVTLRLRNKYDAGIPIVSEIRVLGDLPPAEAAPALLDVSKLPLDHAERYAFVSACKKVPDARLVASLTGMLVPNERGNPWYPGTGLTDIDTDEAAVRPFGGMFVPNGRDIWWNAVEALTKIDTDEAAKALQPHLREETDLLRKLKIAEFLGRHGIRDGYPYTIEHMSEPNLREQAVSALAAIREPRAVGELRKILATSNDVAWNSAAVRGLGRLGTVELAPQLFEMARNAKSPLAPSALIALGDLHEARAVEIARAGFASRNTEILTASARAAGNLVALPGVRADDVRDQLASLLADPGAPQEARAAALESLVALHDPRLDGALGQAVRDAGLEGSDLLHKIEKLLRERKVRLTLA
jgi:HEAT repeat protein